MRALYQLFRYYRRRGAGPIAALRYALRVYRHGF